MSADLFRLVYCSRNLIAGGAGPDELDQILTTARRNNAAYGVTGALLYTDGIFAQTLEGPFDAVQDIFERIQVDERHDDVVVLQAGAVPERLFSAWTMALAEPADPAHARAVLAGVLAKPDDADADGVLGLLECVSSPMAAPATP